MKWLICLMWMIFMAFPQEKDEFRKDREKMVRSQIEARGVADPAILKAMRQVPRHRFVPWNLASRAYEDRPLSIGQEQTISQPYIVAFMTEAIRPEPHFRVLEVGTGSGYQAAVLSEIVDSVFTIEIIEELGTEAGTRLQELGYDNVLVKIGDGYRGWSEKGPFDAIIVTAAAEKIPPPLVEQLKEGGRMIIPVGAEYMTQQLVLLEKKNGEITRNNLLDVRFVPFTRPE